jgi:transcriptional regulator with XRE-family HTH domain
MSQTAAGINDPHGLSPGERLHLLRKRRGYNLRDFAAVVGVSHQAISGYERDEHEPSMSVLRRMAEQLGTTTDYLVGLRHSATPSKHSRKPRPRLAPPNRPIQLPLVGAVR